MTLYADLPIHDVPHTQPRADAAEGLVITGLVAHPRLLRTADILVLPRVKWAAPFRCEEGWVVPSVEWQGFRVTDVLALSGLAPSAQYVRVCAGTYVIVLSLCEASAALLCDRLNGQPLSHEHGAPWRLVVPGGVCFTSVKWVQRLEVTAAPGDSSGERIARARLSQLQQNIPST
jgi:DMSO/TMAO reductase YedYZ molybdopterin-dependent catalytic subunit